MKVRDIIEKACHENILTKDEIKLLLMAEGEDKNLLFKTADMVRKRACGRRGFFKRTY